MSSKHYLGLCYLPSEGEVLRFSPEEIELFTSIDDFWGKREGLVFFPFDRNARAYFFPTDKKVDGVKEFHYSNNETLSKQEYTTSVMMAKDHIHHSEMEKVVLARNEILSGTYSPEESFEEAVHIHSDSYCFMVDLGLEQWVGASPELLMHYDNGMVYTVALAGTKLLDEPFTAKEEEEQHLVELFVEEKLEKVGLSNFHRSEKHEAQFNQIKHLKTSYTAQASDKQALELLKHLHPTSAVCGLPRDLSFDFITDFETMDRSFYSGITGVLKENSATFFVNLRCMRFSEGKVELFSGAGITAESEEEAEWLETERKLDAIKDFLK